MHHAPEGTPSFRKFIKWLCSVIFCFCRANGLTPAPLPSGRGAGVRPWFRAKRETRQNLIKTKQSQFPTASGWGTEKIKRMTEQSQLEVDVPQKYKKDERRPILRFLTAPAKI